MATPAACYHSGVPIERGLLSFSYCSMSYRNPRSQVSRSPSRKPLSKEMLLPLPLSAARTVALSNHLTFAACRAGAGSAYLVNGLIELVYVTYFVQDAGYGETEVIIYGRAEAALERCLQRAQTERVWTIGAAELPLFEAVLQEADRQLAVAPRYVHYEARERLKRFAASGRGSPLMSAAPGH